MGTADHSAQFSCCQSDINIGIARCVLIVTADFKLFRSTGHDTHHNDILGVDVVLVCIPCFCDGAEHLLGRLAGGQVFDEFRIVIFTIFDPARRTGGDQRQCAAVGNTLNQLIGFFHNCQIRCDIGVKHLVKAETAKSGNHFAFYIGSDLHAEAFTQGDTDGGSGLDDHIFGRVVECINDLLAVVPFHNGACGTVHNTLTAGNAGNIA